MAAGRANVAVLISGRGSNMEALARACRDEGFPASISVVVSNRPTAPGLAAAASYGLDTAVVDHTKHPDKSSFEGAIIETLDAHGAEIVCLAGFMRVLSADFVARYPHRILNIHPSLLPSFPGLDVQQKAIDYGVRYSGCTVHFVVPEVDAGPIIAQAAVPVAADDTAETLAQRILEQEHRLYPEALGWLAADRLRIEGRRVAILPEAPGG